MGWFCDHILNTTGVFSHLKVSVALQWKIERTYCIKKFLRIYYHSATHLSKHLYLKGFQGGGRLVVVW